MSGCRSPRLRHRRADAGVHHAASPSPSPAAPWSPAALAWELAEKTGGRYRLGLGSQVGPTSSGATRGVRPPGPPTEGVRAGGAGCLARVPGEEGSTTRGRTDKVGPSRRSGRRASSTRPTRDRHRRGEPWMCAWPARWPTASTSTRSTRRRTSGRRRAAEIAEGRGEGRPRRRERDPARPVLHDRGRHRRGEGESRARARRACR